MFGKVKDRNDVEHFVKGLKDGSVSMSSFLQAMALEGRVFGANFGSETSPITVNTTYDQDQPDIALRVPNAGVMIIPISFYWEFEVSSGTVIEISIVMTQNDIGNGTSSAGTAGPLSLKTDSPYGSVCIPRQLYTGNSSAFTNPLELWRFGQELATAAGAFAPGTVVWEPMVKPVLVGPASLVVGFENTTTAAQGFGQLIWAEVPVGGV